MEIFIVIVLCLILFILLAINSTLNSINGHLSEIETVATNNNKNKENDDWVY